MSVAAQHALRQSVRTPGHLRTACSHSGSSRCSPGSARSRAALRQMDAFWVISETFIARPQARSYPLDSGDRQGHEVLVAHGLGTCARESSFPQRRRSSARPRVHVGPSFWAAELAPVTRSRGGAPAPRARTGAFVVTVRGVALGASGDRGLHGDVACVRLRASWTCRRSCRRTSIAAMRARWFSGRSDTVRRFRTRSVV